VRQLLKGFRLIYFGDGARQPGLKSQYTLTISSLYLQRAHHQLSGITNSNNDEMPMDNYNTNEAQYLEENSEIDEATWKEIELKKPHGPENNGEIPNMN